MTPTGPRASGAKGSEWRRARPAFERSGLLTPQTNGNTEDAIWRSPPVLESSARLIQIDGSACAIAPHTERAVRQERGALVALGRELWIELPATPLLTEDLLVRHRDGRVKLDGLPLAILTNEHACHPYRPFIAVRSFETSMPLGPGNVAQGVNADIVDGDSHVPAR